MINALAWEYSCNILEQEARAEFTATTLKQISQKETRIMVTLSLPPHQTWPLAIFSCS